MRDRKQATKPLEPAPAGPRAVWLKEGRLVVTQGPDTGRRFLLRAPGARVGKDEDNDLVLKDETVSGRHLTVEETEHGFLVRDEASTNGTFVDRTRIREAYLTPGCTIQLGGTALRFEPPTERVQIQPSARDRFGDLHGESARMRQVFGILEKVAPTDATVLITGETGTGKEVVARSLHAGSRRAAHPFVVFDCSAIARELLESALLGHREGAFTGAVKDRQGVFVAASSGTLFIDEIGELPLDLQPKLLRALEQREVVPLGTDSPRKVDVRVLAATHRDLRAMVREGAFRQDLFYRLSVIEVRIPPLRERREDVPLLARRFVAAAGRAPDSVTPAALDALMARPWEGNVRELKNLIERALVFAGDDPVDVAHLAGTEPPTSAGDGLLSGEKSLAEVEAEVILATLQRTKWNKTRAAQILGITRQTLLDKVNRYKIEKP